MDNNISSMQKYSLTRLKKYLNYEVSTSILFFLSFQVFIFIFFALAAAIIFTPFMLYVLFKEDKKGWIVLFFIIVIIPIIIFIILAILLAFSKPLLLIPMGLFYFYCFLLRYEVNTWVRELNFKNQYLEDKKQKEIELELFMKQLGDKD